MIEELNLQCPYKVTSNSDLFTYSFTTDYKVEYSVAFIDSTHMFTNTSTGEHLSGIYTINIDKMNDIAARGDSKVRETIESIVEHFFNDRERALIYICDYIDGKHYHRKRKFNGWFKGNYSCKDYIKHDAEFNSEEGLHLASIIYHVEHPFISNIENSYYEVVESLNKP
ncbi:DUF6169 family protein [Flavobacterium sp.]|uniref:DUF6169 family protein n=1 Tax=Flavobacterium sp. TaxID=239 RepID=UPI003A948502